MVNRIPTDMIEDRTSGQKLSEQLADITQENLKTKYSAKGDGTTIDTVALQNAALSGKHIQIPQGTYVINGTLNFNPFTRFVAQGKVIFKIISDVTVIKLCFQNQVEGIDFDVTPVVPYTKDIFEISSATMQGKTDWDWKVDIKINRVSLKSANPSSGVTGTFFNIWAARLDPDGVTSYDKTGFWGINIKEVDLNGYFGFFCRNWAYQATGVTDDGWITGIHFENVNINTARYGFFGSKSEADMNNLLYRDCGNLILDNVQMQCNGSKRFAFFSSLGKTISNSIPWDWQKSNPVANPILIQYRTSYPNSKITMDYGYGNYDLLFDVNNAPSYMSTREKLNWVKYNLSNYVDSFNGQMTGRLGVVPFSIGGTETMPMWIKVVDFTSKYGQFTAGFMLSNGYMGGNFGIVSVTLTVTDANRLDQATNPVLKVVTTPFVPDSNLFDFYVSKQVQGDGNTTYKIYMKLTTNTLGAGFYYSPFSAYGDYIAPIYLEKLATAPSETVILGASNNVSYLKTPKILDGGNSYDVPVIQSGSAQSNATIGAYVDVTFNKAFKTGFIPKVIVTPRSTDPSVQVTTALVTATGFRLYCSHASINCDYIAVL